MSEVFIDVLSDLHGYSHNFTLQGDILLLCGDITAADRECQYEEFEEWLDELEYKCVLIIGGNHDNKLQEGYEFKSDKVHYLCDSGYTFEGLNFWGTPWTATFQRQNRYCKAFSIKDESERLKHFEKIPGNTDVLISHSPPFGKLDFCCNGRKGCVALEGVVNRVRPKMHVFGHIHEQGGKIKRDEDILYANCAFVDEWYRPRKKGSQFVYKAGIIIPIEDL
jgi:Icc-related predicted phosphoesterase